jgi:Fe-S-cluster-containing hydrogenase component 2
MSYESEYDFDEEIVDDESNLLTEIDKIDREDSASERSKKATLVHINYDLCENSSVCAQVCPEDVIETRNGQSVIVRAHKCTECWICVENCASGAVEIG